MRSQIAPVKLFCLFIVLAGFKGSPSMNEVMAVNVNNTVLNFNGLTNSSGKALKNPATLYSILNLEEKGLSEAAFNYAWKGYQYLVEKNLLARPEYLTICDYSQPSSKKRLYIIDIATNELLINTYVAHGRNSGVEYAYQFSNHPRSLQSSLGFFITQNTYIGTKGLALRINGVDAGFNDKALERGIVIHGADYVDETRIQQGMFLGRSFGCPVVSVEETATIINRIKDGTCFFIYHPDRKYFSKSKILND
jgi:hypothetical protein